VQASRPAPGSGTTAARAAGPRAMALAALPRPPLQTRSTQPALGARPRPAHLRLTLRRMSEPSR
jgi:hypothetical protein